MFSELLSEVRQRVISTIFRYRPVLPEAIAKAQADKSKDIPAETNTMLNSRASEQQPLEAQGKKKRKRH